MKWELEECDGWDNLYNVRDESGNVIAAGVSKTVANLIAAAPELLSELTSILRCFDRDNIVANHFAQPMGTGARVYITYSQVKRVRAAIARQ